MSLEKLNFIDLNGPKITTADLERFEGVYRVHIPQELKALFLEKNDCMLEYPNVDCSGIDGGVMPERWVGISGNGMNYLLDLFGDSLGGNVVPFCRDPGGGIFALTMNDKNESGVYFINIDEPYEEGGLRRYKSYHLADNLSDFVSKIKFG